MVALLRRKINLKTKLIILFVSITFTLVILDLKLRPIIKSIMADKAKSVAVNAIDKAINRELGSQNIQYSDIVQIERAEEGKLLGITTNIQKINCLKSCISKSISDELSKEEIKKIKIPLGTILGTEILSGSGPIVNVKLFVTGNVVIDFESELSEAGINQTKHRINLKVEVNVSAIIPGYPVETKVETSITIAETVIVGEVPKVYAAPEPTKKIREAKALEGLGNS